MSAFHRLLNLNKRLIVGKDVDGQIYVHYEGCDVKGNGVLISICGRGTCFDLACEDYLTKISGKTLVFNAESSDRHEVVVL